MVDLVTADGTSVQLTFQPTDGTEINVYPVFERFELDLHLGKLARLLRL